MLQSSPGNANPNQESLWGSGGKEIAVILGVLLDPKLNWKQHLTEIKEILLIYVDM
jgi:hypothetical protein